MRGVHRGFTARQFSPILFLLTVLLLAILAACTGIKEKEVDMLVRTTIPPVDTSAPAKTETATFSLG